MCCVLSVFYDLLSARSVSITIRPKINTTLEIFYMKKLKKEVVRMCFRTFNTLKCKTSENVQRIYP